jgi:hypothetical protein
MALFCYRRCGFNISIFYQVTLQLQHTETFIRYQDKMD